MLKGVNAYRVSHGVPELQNHAGLASLAQKHSEFMRQNRGKFELKGKQGRNITHLGFEGRTLVARQRYNITNCVENVAYVSNTSKGVAPTIVGLWANSKTHDSNMRGPSTHTGIGIVKDTDGTIFFTELFGTIGNSQITTRNRFNGF